MRCHADQSSLMCFPVPPCCCECGAPIVDPAELESMELDGMAMHHDCWIEWSKEQGELNQWFQEFAFN